LFAGTRVRHLLGVLEPSIGCGAFPEKGTESARTG
jgi:hypothetical protein